MTPSPHRLPRAVIWLGVVSLLTDASSDMIFPLLPIFLAELGAGPRMLGVIEGAAEAVASMLKLISGKLADRARGRKGLTVFGYSVSSLARPLAGLATAPWMILVVRVADRIGKGLRTSPRDALLADVTPPERRGRAYGFHRAMDNAGSVIGPAIATALVALHFQLRTIFLLAIIPAGFAMAALVFGVKEPERPAKAEAEKTREPARPTGSLDDSVTEGAPVAPKGDSPNGALVRYLCAVALFTLGNASDAFLLLRAAELGVPKPWIPTVWLVNNAVRAALGMLGGSLSDRVGRRRMIIAGWILYSGVYLGFGYATVARHIWVLIPLYGLHYAFVEGSEKALVADLAPAGGRGRAFGWFNAVVGLGALPASLGFGVLAQNYGARLPFTIAAGLAITAALILALAVPEPRRR